MTADFLFELPPSLAHFAPFFRPDMMPWEWVGAIKNALESLDWSKYPPRTDIPAGVALKGKVFIHPEAILPPYAVIEGPAWIGAKTEIRPSAYIRGNVIVGEGCVIGNSCEFKNSLLLDKVQVPHFNYVGDSVLGNRSHLGAGAICANLRMDHGNVPVKLDSGERVDTGMRKLGALMGDGAEASCNSVLQPGAILGRHSIVISMPFNGFLPPDSIAHAGIRAKILPRHMV
jgi:UDP-N-acetylglucosamine diphosphorylase / glucose-1-phosphate thymidylyltransferase / UDP-N-acetylgalactosamine diphosphorylase / glucosamine-1-phosphate N-acetyltransferase / galactosamine-1-phosphate N-acetyltransferase